MRHELDINLAELRRSHGVTQVDQARRMGVTQSRVSAIETAAPGSLRLSTLGSYLDALGVRAELLVRPADVERQHA
ncbi:helix-turn-helix transcriptional regulator [Streptomyces durbertensis]|uniref:Helix-turn-helix transcriptional regulator n=1 Tax=Streptomyces durbertensis TaxID=2448886 RepID=A0ABR6EFX1_9ACTN|nr:helix-turn-helix transcriptional regulator [Streptomyces durbertensis]MBB1243855.1 helix-turn-helix transcriptional regulator [Streptomyces durbertensis]